MMIELSQLCECGTETVIFNIDMNLFEDNVYNVHFVTFKFASERPESYETICWNTFISPIRHVHSFLNYSYVPQCTLKMVIPFCCVTFWSIWVTSLHWLATSVQTVLMRVRRLYSLWRTLMPQPKKDRYTFTNRCFGSKLCLFICYRIWDFRNFYRFHKSNQNIWSTLKYVTICIKYYNMFNKFRDLFELYQFGRILYTTEVYATSSMHDPHTHTATLCSSNTYKLICERVNVVLFSLCIYIHGYY